jgi:hypothetical protein
MQDVEQLKRSAETARKRCDGGVLASIKSDSESSATTDVLPRKDVPVLECQRCLTFHCFDLDGHDSLPTMDVVAGTGAIRSGCSA